MKNYIAHMQTKEPHERRRHALGVAALLSGLLAVAWLATLGMRINTQAADANAQSAAAAQAQAANETQLQISDTSVYSY